MFRIFGHLVLVTALASLLPSRALAFSKQHAPYDGDAPPALSDDCVLSAFNVCSGWIWVYGDAPGAVWGTLFSPEDCPGGCASGGAVSEVLFYARCEAGPAQIGGVRITSVDPFSKCATETLFDTGPFTITHCTPGDRWTCVPIPLVRVEGEFAVQLIWGPDDGLRFATDNAAANFACMIGLSGGYPGCLGTEASCAGWDPFVPSSFVYVTDWNGDTVLDDLCAEFGYPSFFAYEILYWIVGYENLLLSVALDCHSPTSVESTSWGRVKALYR